MVNEIVLKEVNRLFKCDILDTSRQPNNVSGRIAFSSFIRGFSRMTVTEIGRCLNKNHATICHYLRKHDLYYQYDADYRKRYNKLKKPKTTKRTICCYTTLEFLIYKQAS